MTRNSRGAGKVRRALTHAARGDHTPRHDSFIPLPAGVRHAGTSRHSGARAIQPGSLSRISFLIARKSFQHRSQLAARELADIQPAVVHCHRMVISLSRSRRMVGSPER
jgi:hypothetical protein